MANETNKRNVHRGVITIAHDTCPDRLAEVANKTGTYCEFSGEADNGSGGNPIYYFYGALDQLVEVAKELELADGTDDVMVDVPGNPVALTSLI